jgi:NADH-quinone oxidoreductase subunit N
MKAILLLSGLGVLALFAELFKFRKALFPLVVLGLLGTIATAVSYWWYDDGEYAKYFGGMVNFEGSSVVTSVIMLGTALLWFIMAGNYLRKETSETDHTALVLFALVGAMILTCYTNMVMLFLGIEILSIPLYVLAGSRKNEPGSNEAAFKYFLLGAFASAFLLFGIALVFGATGSFDGMAIGQFIQDHAELPGFFYGGVVMILVGMLFKISAAPFHFWAPDVYQGSPTVFTAFMSTVVKTAAIVAILRLFNSYSDGHQHFLTGASNFWMPILAVCVGLTFVIGNLSAAVQTSVKRMLAFSSISHAGFLLLAIVAASVFTPKAIIFYTVAYSVASILAFTVLISVIRATGSDDVEGFNGLGKKNPLLAVVMCISLLSLAGIPPTAGFFAKYYVLTAAIESGHYWLAIIGILSSLVGVYYYFKIIIAMYFKAPKEELEYTSDAQHQALLFVTAVATIVLGLLPDLILNIGAPAQVVAETLPQ